MIFTISKNKHKIATISLATIFLAACGGANGTADGDGGDDTVSLRVTTPIGGPEGIYNAPVTEYLDAVAEATDGAVDYEYFYEGSLVAGDEVPSALESGVADMAVMVTSFTPSDFPIDTWISQLAFEGDHGVPSLVMQRSSAIMDWWHSHKEIMDAEFEAKNIMALAPGMAPSPTYQLLCTEPVNNLQEAQGKQVRTPGPAWVAEAEALGMTPVSLPGYEMYEAMQRGVIDCGMTDAPDIISSGFWEVGKNHTTVGLTGFTSMGLFLNQDVWEQLSPTLQEAFIDNLPTYFAGVAERAVDAQYDLVVEGEERDVEFFTAEEDMEEALATHREELVTRLSEDAPAAISDPEAVIADYQDRHSKWADILTDDLGYTATTTWEDWVNQVEEASDFDAMPWAERLVEEVYY